jgi:uncharacterized protein (TIGR04551 family)
MPWSPRSAPPALLAVAVLVSSVEPSHAQGLGPSPTVPAAEPEKPEGVAEQAPSTPGALPTTPVLPPPRTQKKKFELFELDGYFRFRGDWFKNFNLGFDDVDADGGAPFAEPLACISPPGGTSDTSDDLPCENSFKTANLRLRLEPVIHIDERASVHFQVDVLDNLVLGSTPDAGTSGSTGTSPIPVLGNGRQAPPEAGHNFLYDSIRVKRAWAEVNTPLGLLKFGRQPSHWGLGILENSGGADPIHGDYDLDSDHGDTVDRLYFSTIVPGTSLRAGIATDWAASGPSSAQTGRFTERSGGQPFDLEDNDDVNQWVFVLSRIDSPEDVRDAVDQGELVLNYGAYLAYRTQSWDHRATTEDDAGTTGPVQTLVRRDAKMYLPDLWARLAWGKLELEFEGVMVLGSIDRLDDVQAAEELVELSNGLDIRQIGAVGRLGYRLLDGDLRLGMELGFASGDQWDAPVQGRTHARDAATLYGNEVDGTLTAFRFDFDYKVDLILFRELLGAVHNATYVRPSLRYDITDRIGFNVQSVVSFANKPVSTPGNGQMYGIEFDGDLGYHHEGFSAGIAYGVLFPLGALDHPAGDQGGADFGFPLGNQGDAGTAHTIQSRLVLKF